MAATEIVNAVLNWNEAGEMPAGVEIDAAGGALIPAAADQRMLILLEADAAGDIVVKAGNGLQGVRDLTVTFDGAGTKAVTVESGAYVNMSGPNRGKIHITGSGKAACVVLP